MKLLESGENYLKRILILSTKNEHVRSIDLAKDMGFSKPSVSIGLKKLKESGYVEVDDKGFVTLTERGYEVASSTLERHETLTAFFVSLGVDEETAKDDACKVEHDLSEETFEAIKNRFYSKKH